MRLNEAKYEYKKNLGNFSSVSLCVSASPEDGESHESVVKELKKLVHAEVDTVATFPEAGELPPRLPALPPMPKAPPAPPAAPKAAPKAPPAAPKAPPAPPAAPKAAPKAPPVAPKAPPAPPAAPKAAPKAPKAPKTPVVLVYDCENMDHKNVIADKLNEHCTEPDAVEGQPPTIWWKLESYLSKVKELIKSFHGYEFAVEGPNGVELTPEFEEWMISEVDKVREEA